MPRRAGHTHTMYLDEAEGFLLEHALISPPRAWPPLPPQSSQQARVTSTKRKMDWEGQMRDLPDESVKVPRKATPEDADKERCVICLMALRDRTIVGVCGHEFCVSDFMRGRRKLCQFECIGVWSNQSRRCPLCSADMAPFLLHDLDDTTPTKFYLPPLPQRRQPTFTLPGQQRLPLPEEREREQEMKEMDELDIQVERRREIYQYGLYAKHIGSNPITRFRPNPSPRQIADDPILVQRATTFMRRELRVWSSVDVEFLTTYVLSLLKAIDIRSEPAIRLLAEYLEDPDNDGPNYPNGPEHFAHELYSFLRSPFRELRKWDDIIQYDAVPTDRSRPPSPIPSLKERDRPPSPPPRSRGSRSPSPSSSTGRSRSRSRSSSLSPSARSRSGSYSRSPSRPRSPRPDFNLSPRDPRRHDSYIPPPSPNARRWDEADTWIDPEYAAEMEEARQAAEEKRTEKRRRSELPLIKRIELLPSPPPPPLRMDEWEKEESPSTEHPSISIRGAAAAPVAKLTLFEKLQKAKAEAVSKNVDAPPISVISTPPPLVHSTSDPAEAAMSKPGVRAAVQARLRLRLKLASEKKAYVYNQNESRAQILRAQIFEAKAKREADETDAVLRHMDKVDRAREVRRRLMVLKMMAAETDSERRARELKEKLMGDKKAKMLRMKLMERKKSGGGAAGAVAVEA